VYTLSTRVAFLAMGGERQTRMEVLDWLELNGGRVLEVSIGTGVNLRYLFESPDVGAGWGASRSGVAWVLDCDPARAGFGCRCWMVILQEWGCLSAGL
jgi:hypothetical protein